MEEKMNNIKAKIITVATMKGGAGKTTVCFKILGGNSRLLVSEMKACSFLSQYCNYMYC